MTVRLLADSEVVKSNSIFVKTDKLGFPVIIPKDLRDVILSKETPFYLRGRMVGALLTILSIGRVFSTKVEPTLKTIIEPFNGTSKTLDGSLLINSLKELNLYQSHDRLEKCKLY